MNRQSHWNKVWTRNREGDVSWFQERPDLSINLVQRHAAGTFPITWSMI